MLRKLNSILILTTVIIIFSFTAIVAQNSYIEFKQGDTTRVVHFINESVVRISLSIGDTKIKQESKLVNELPKKVQVHYEEAGNLALVVSKYIILYVNLDNGAIKFEDWKGYKSIEEDDKKLYEIIPVSEDSSSFNIKQHFKIPENHIINVYDPFQLEAKITAFANIRGKELKSSKIGGIERLPFLYSNGNYGIFWDNYSKSIFHDDEDGTWISSDSAKYIDYYYISGPNLEHIISKYRDLLGMDALLLK